MASKRRLRRKRCGHKQPCADKQQARAAIYHQRHKWTAHMSAYECPHCGHYHIGHTPRRQLFSSHAPGASQCY